LLNRTDLVDEKTLIEAEKRFRSFFGLVYTQLLPFSVELCRRLEMGPIPDWVLSLAETGAEFRSGAPFVMD